MEVRTIYALQSALSLIRIYLILLALTPFWGCLDIEYTGRIYNRGEVHAKLHFVLPPITRKEWYPSLFGEGVSSFTVALERNQVRYRPDPTRKNAYRVQAKTVSRLSLPWFVLNYWEPRRGLFAYAHGISFPPEILTELKRDLSQRFQALPSADRNPQALAEGMVAQGKILLRWTFPGTVTETNGVKLNHRTVQWVIKSSDLERGSFQMGYAFGATSFWQRVKDRVILFYYHLFSRI